MQNVHCIWRLQSESAACVDCRVHRLRSVEVQTAVSVFSFSDCRVFTACSGQTAGCIDVESAKCSLYVQTAECLNVQTADCSLLIQMSACLDVQTSECSVHCMFRLQCGHSSDYSDGLTVQDVPMAQCWNCSVSVESYYDSSVCSNCSDCSESSEVSERSHLLGMFGLFRKGRQCRNRLD